MTYKGVPLTMRTYNEHPEIHHLYPTPTVFMEKIYRPQLKWAEETGRVPVIEIEENSVKINGVRFEGHLDK